MGYDMTQRFDSRLRQIRGLGTAYMVIGIIATVAVGVLLLAVVALDEVEELGARTVAGVALAAAIVGLAVSVLYIVVGVGLRNFRPWARMAAIVVAIIGLVSAVASFADNDTRFNGVGSVVLAVLTFVFLGPRQAKEALDWRNSVGPTPPPGYGGAPPGYPPPGYGAVPPRPGYPPPQYPPPPGPPGPGG